MDPLWFALTAVAAVALAAVAVRSFLRQIGGKDVFLGRHRPAPDDAADPPADEDS